jgi:hypothetical protein
MQGILRSTPSPAAGRAGETAFASTPVVTIPAADQRGERFES